MALKEPKIAQFLIHPLPPPYYWEKGGSILDVLDV